MCDLFCWEDCDNAGEGVSRSHSHGRQSASALLEKGWENYRILPVRPIKSSLTSRSVPHCLSKIFCFNVKLPNMVFHEPGWDVAECLRHINIH